MEYIFSKEKDNINMKLGDVYRHKKSNSIIQLSLIHI